MGNCCSDVGVPSDHWIYVRTGDRKGAGTDANVRLILHDKNGHASPEIKLDCVFRNDFERGNTDVFRAPELSKDFVELEKIEIWRDNAGVSPDWYCDLIVINDRRNDVYYYFPINRWVQPSVHYVITNYDTSLPQLDLCAEEREVSLQEKRKFYQYDQRAPGLPVQVMFCVPRYDICFSIVYVLHFQLLYYGMKQSIDFQHAGSIFYLSFISYTGMLNGTFSVTWTFVYSHVFKFIKKHAH